MTSSPSCRALPPTNLPHGLRSDLGLVLVLILVLGSTHTVLGSSAPAAPTSGSKPTIAARIPAEPGQKVVLASVRLHQSDTVALAVTDSQGLVVFNLPPHSYHGFYQVVWPGGQNLVLWDGTPVDFEALGPDSVLIHKGTSWQQYRDTRAELIRIRAKMDLIRSLNTEFPQADMLLEGARIQLKLLEQNETAVLAKIKAPSAGVGLRLLSLEAPFVGNHPDRLREFLKPGMYLRLMDLSDTLHLHHNILPKLVVEYYRLFEPDSVYSEEIQAMRFVESIMEHLRERPTYLVPVADFLRLGLQQMQQPKALQLLSHKLSESPGCSDSELERKLKENLRHYAPISPGAMAPSLDSLVNGAGQAVQIKPGQGLYVFWAADCGHCLEQLPKLHRWWSTKHPDWAVTTVSVGGSTSDWTAFTAGLPGWTHLRDPQGRQGPTVEAYVLYATPLFVKVDAQGLISDVFRAESSLELTY